MKITNYKIADNFKIKKQVKEKDEIIKEYDLVIEDQKETI